MPKIFEQQETNITHAIHSEGAGSFIVRVQSRGITKSLSFPYADGGVPKIDALFFAKAAKAEMLACKREERLCRISESRNGKELKQCSI